MEKILITGIQNGVLTDPEQFKINCQYFEGKKVDITIKNHVDKSSTPQKRYFFGVVFKHISEFMGAHGVTIDAEQLYEHYKYRGYFGYCEVLDEPIPQGLSKCTTQQANEAKERIQQEWAEKNLIIPDPNQKDFLETTEQHK